MKALVFISVIFACLTGCNKDNGYQDTGTIIGFDYRKCMCCSGWFIRIDKDTLRFQQLPEGSVLNFDNAVYPVEVNLDWHIPDPRCMDDLIIVTRIELKK